MQVRSRVATRRGSNLAQTSTIRDNQVSAVCGNPLPSPSSTMPGQVANNGQSETKTKLFESISRIFDQAQSSLANHQKNFVALYKLHKDAATHTEPTDDGRGMKLIGEREFEDVFLDMVFHILPLKKGITQADKIVKFVGGYAKFINEKAAKKDDVDDGDEPFSTRFTSRLLRTLQRGFVAKDKNVRFRVVQLVAEMILHLGEMDEETYTGLRAALLVRIRDKEPIIRVHSVVAFTRLCGSEDPDDLAEGEPSLLQVLEETLAYDPSADVRRAALLNIPLMPETMEAVLTRTRDTDTTVRKLVFSSVLDKNTTVNDDEMGPTHPRALKISQREVIVRNGLGDREPSVRAVAGVLMSTWMISSKADSTEEKVINFLKLFDLTDNTVAEDALLSVFLTDPEVFDGLEFPESYWSELTPEKAFLARVFVEHCINIKANAKLEAALPVVTALAFRIQSAYNELMDAFNNDDINALLGDSKDDDDDDEQEGNNRKDEIEEERLDKEFVISEMLRLVVNLDYSDEIGRRKMRQLVREMIARHSLPEGLLPKCLDVMRKLSLSERDLIREVVEVVHELRDPTENEEEKEEAPGNDDTSTTFGSPDGRAAKRAIKPAEEMSPEERARADAMDLRCLTLCIGMLERVNGTFEENSTLEGILGELILPSIQRKEAVLREKGLICLGLCCLIARRMATSSFNLFLSQFKKSPDALKVCLLQIIFDILMVQESDFLGKGADAQEFIVGQLLEMLEMEYQLDKVQTVLCSGIAKLALSGMLTDIRILESLYFAYVSPDTSDNQELRQCLAYFFPVYCYSSPANQKRMKDVFIPAFKKLADDYREDGQDMVSPAIIGAMFADWTDPQKALTISGQGIDHSIHVDLAYDIIKSLFDKELLKEDKKVLCQLLSKLYIPDSVDGNRLRELKLLLHSIPIRAPLGDATAKNAITKFDAMLSKKFEKELAGFSEAEYRQMEELQEIFAFLDDIVPLDSDNESEAPKKRARRKRRSASASSNNSSTDESQAASHRKGSGKAKPKKRRVSGSEDDEGTERGTPPARRPVPKRAAAPKKSSLVPEVDEEGEEEEDLEEATPIPSRKASKAKSRKQAAAEMPPESEVSDAASQGNQGSVMDEDSSEDEVEDLLDDQE